MEKWIENAVHRYFAGESAKESLKKVYEESERKEKSSVK